MRAGYFRKSLNNLAVRNYILVYIFARLQLAAPASSLYTASHINSSIVFFAEN